MRRCNFVIGGNAAFVDAEEEDDGAAAAAAEDVVPVRHHHQLHTKLQLLLLHVNPKWHRILSNFQV